MPSVGNSTAPFNATSDVFVTGASGVAALDTPQLSQTKLEIRGIVAEIAEFSATQLPQAEFLNAVLPRICSAMGASSAALWRTDTDRRVELLGHFRLPATLLPVESGDGPSLEQINHSKILACVAAEGSPVLVPPKSVRIASDRPVNPVDECLVVVPINIDERFEMLLEVIQPASGGPAAQRGYLRFVAQMADLMSDYLRRDRLRQFANTAAYVKSLQATLLSITGAADETARFQRAAAGLCQLLNAELVMVARRRRIVGWPTGYRVCAVSNLTTFDSRSEVVLAAEQFLAVQKNSYQTTSDQTTADRFSLVATDELSSEEPAEHDQPSAYARCSQQLRALLGCSHLGQLRFDDRGECIALLAFDQNCEFATVRQRAIELTEPFQSLLFLAPALPIADQGANALAAKTKISRGWRRAVGRTTARASFGLLVLAAGLIPTPDNISTVAVLEPSDKELYYAPSSATIDVVEVDTHQAVKKGDRLIQLVDYQLQMRLEELLGQQRSTREQLENDELTRKQGKLSPQEDRQLVYRVDQAKINLEAITEQLRIVQTQIDQLTITARRDARIATWDARNQLRGRPVVAGQLLLTTHQPNAPWQLRVSIPERQLGRLRAAMAGAREGLPVQFSLTANPSEVRHGRLVNVSEQLIKDDGGVGKAMGIVAIDGNSLPSKSDGAVARATIACGRTCVGWLAIRDAYREASAWWRLNW